MVGEVTFPEALAALGVLVTFSSLFFVLCTALGMTREADEQ